MSDTTTDLDIPDAAFAALGRALGLAPEDVDRDAARIMLEAVRPSLVAPELHRQAAMLREDASHRAPASGIADVLERHANRMQARAVDLSDEEATIR